MADRVVSACAAGFGVASLTAKVPASTNETEVGKPAAHQAQAPWRVKPSHAAGAKTANTHTASSAHGVSPSVTRPPAVTRSEKAATGAQIRQVSTPSASMAPLRHRARLLASSVDLRLVIASCPPQRK